MRGDGSGAVDVCHMIEDFGEDPPQGLHLLGVEKIDEVAADSGDVIDQLPDRGTVALLLGLLQHRHKSQ